MINTDLPLYRIEVSLDDDSTFMNCISLVDDPAMEVDFICLEKEAEQIRLSRDEKEHIVFGPAIIADKPIYRRNGDYEYYVVFTPETIKTIVHKYSKQGLINSVNLMHYDNAYIDSAVMVQFFIKDTPRGISPAGFEEVSDGSLFVAYKIEDDKLWDMIEDGDTFRGFSIEVNANLIPSQFSAEPKDDIEAVADAWIEGVKKKSDRFAGVRQLARSMDEQRQLMGTIDRKVTVFQVWGLGSDDAGNDIAVIYIPKREEWRSVRARDIKGARLTDRAYAEWKYDASWRAISEHKDITVRSTVNPGEDTWGGLIAGGRWVMINYNDELPNPHQGARQCMVVAHGLTRRGNECIRVYERYGDSRSAAEGYGEIPDYRLLLTRRITSVKVIGYMEPWGPDDLDSRYNWGGDDSMSAVYEWYH